MTKRQVIAGQHSRDVAADATKCHHSSVTRNMPEIFCWILTMRKSRSAWLLDQAVNYTVSLSGGRKLYGHPSLSSLTLLVPMPVKSIGPLVKAVRICS